MTTSTENQPPLADYEALHEAFVRITDGTTVQSGFWIDRRLVASCAHGFPSHELGSILTVEWKQVVTTGEILSVDRVNDVLLLGTQLSSDCALVPLGKDVRPPDRLYAFGYTSRNREGESLTLEMEGWSRAPMSLKFKQGQVELGMSGAAVYALRSRAIVAMLRVSRDVRTSAGGRGVPASTILEVAGSAGLLSEKEPMAAVTLTDLPTVLGIFEAAYSTTRPIAAVDQAIISDSHQPWLQAEIASSALQEVLRHDDARQAAVERWYAASPSTLRFILLPGDSAPRRIGATCVLPLTQAAYMNYRAGRVREFEFDAGDLAQPGAPGAQWLCFQSFALSSRGGEREHEALRDAMVTHVRSIAGESTVINVIAEIGTQPGLVEAQHFNMRFCGLSALARPLFELDGAAVARWLAGEAPGA